MRCILNCHYTTQKILTSLQLHFAQRGAKGRRAFAASRLSVGLGHAPWLRRAEPRRYKKAVNEKLALH